MLSRYNLMQRKTNALSLELQFLNGNGTSHKVPVYSGIIWTPDSQAGIDLLLEESAKVPPTIRNEAEATRIKELVPHLREGIRSIEAVIEEEKAPTRTIHQQLDAVAKVPLNQLQERIRQYLSALADWETKVREGARTERQRQLQKKEELERQAEEPTLTPAAAATIRRNLLAVEQAAKDAAPKTSPGMTYRPTWVAQLIDPLKFVRSRYGKFAEVGIDQQALNAHLRELEEGGHTIDPNHEIPCVKLVRKGIVRVTGG